MSGAGAFTHRMDWRRLLDQPQDALGGHALHYRRMGFLWVRIGAETAGQVALAPRVRRDFQRGDRLVKAHPPASCYEVVDIIEDRHRRGAVTLICRRLSDEHLS